MGHVGVKVKTRDRLFNAYFEQVESYTLLMRAQARSIFYRFLETAALPGDFIELGAWKGGISFLLALAIKDLGIKKRVYLCDGFQGLPEPDPDLDKPFRKGSMQVDFELVQKLVRDLSLEDIVTIVPGWFDASLAKIPKDSNFNLAHLDCDLYASTRVALQYVLPRLVPGGALVIDDFLFHGVKGVPKAVAEVVGPKAHLHLGPKTQVYIFPKGNPATRTQEPKWRTFGSYHLDVSDLLGDTDYLEYLEREEVHFNRRATEVARYRQRLLNNTGTGDAADFKATSDLGLLDKMSRIQTRELDQPRLSFRIKT